MVEPGVDEGLGVATWPLVRVKHHYAVSEALPLHRLGLVPPPPELGPHLLTASTLEAALAAAEATAELQAIGAVVPLPVPDAKLEGETALAPILTSNRESMPFQEVASEVQWPEASPVTDAESAAALSADAPLSISQPAGEAAASWLVGSQLETAHASDQTSTTANSVEPAWTLSAEADGDDPLQIGPPEPATLTAALANAGGAEAPAHGKLMRLDLSRRGDAPPAKEMPLPPMSEASPSALSTPPPPMPPTATAAPLANAPTSAAKSPSDARPRMPQNDPPSGNWPGFLTGIVMAVAIGVGLYVSLVGS